MKPLGATLVTQQLVIHDLTRLGENNTKLEVHASFLFLKPENILLDIRRDHFPRDLLHLVQVAVIGKELEM